MSKKFIGAMILLGITVVVLTTTAVVKKVKSNKNEVDKPADNCNNTVDELSSSESDSSNTSTEDNEVIEDNEVTSDCHDTSTEDNEVIDCTCVDVDDFIISSCNAYMQKCYELTINILTDTYAHVITECNGIVDLFEYANPKLDDTFLTLKEKYIKEYNSYEEVMKECEPLVNKFNEINDSDSYDEETLIYLRDVLLPKYEEWLHKVNLQAESTVAVVEELKQYIDDYNNSIKEAEVKDINSEMSTDSSSDTNTNETVNNEASDVQSTDSVSSEDKKKAIETVKEVCPFLNGEHDFDNTEDLFDCLNCPYKAICPMFNCSDELDCMECHLCSVCPLATDEAKTKIQKNSK